MNIKSIHIKNVRGLGDRKMIIKNGRFIAGGEWLWNRKQDFIR